MESWGSAGGCRPWWWVRHAIQVGQRDVGDILRECIGNVAQFDQ